MLYKYDNVKVIDYITFDKVLKSFEKAYLQLIESQSKSAHLSGWDTFKNYYISNPGDKNLWYYLSLYSKNDELSKDFLDLVDKKADLIYIGKDDDLFNVDLLTPMVFPQHGTALTELITILLRIKLDDGTVFICQTKAENSVTDDLTHVFRLFNTIRILVDTEIVVLNTYIDAEGLINYIGNDENKIIVTTTYTNNKVVAKLIQVVYPYHHNTKNKVFITDYAERIALTDNV